MTKDVQRYVEMDVDSLVPYENNARTHSEEQVDKIVKSIEEFGFINPVLVNKDNVIIAGHGRVMAAKKMGREKVPCLFVEHLSEEQMKAYVIADNKLAEEAGWDMQILASELESLQLADFDISLTGFDSLDEIVFDMEEKEVVEDDFEVVVPEEPKAKLGDIYQLGNHRLMCGDSTSIDDVEKLMNGEKADMVFTDPPYNCNYGHIKHHKFKQRHIENDNMSSEAFQDFCTDFTANILEFCKGCVYLCAGQGADGRIMFTVADNMLHNSTTIIWNKDQFTLGCGKYQNKYEPIWFGWTESGKDFTDGRTLSNVWDIPRPKKSELHPTMKPIELVETALKHNPKSKTVLDLFGGSGTTLIASEQIGRNCYMMEHDPRYVDVIIDRWEQFTGQKAVLLNGNS